MTEQQRHFDLIIGGGGVVGLSLALALVTCLGRGMRIAVVEKNAGSPAEGRVDGRAWAISAASRNLFDVIGIWQDLAPHAQPVRKIVITDTSLESPVRMPLLAFDNDLPSHRDADLDIDPQPAAWIVENRLIVDTVLRHVRDLGGSDIELIAPATIESQFVEDGAAGVKLVDGRSLTAPLIVAADGRNSELRARAGIKTVGWDYGQHGIVVPLAHENDHEGCAVQHFLPSGPFALLPLRGRRTSLVWTERAERAREIMALSDAGFLEEVERRVAGHLYGVRLDGPRGSWPLSMLIARSFVANRFALAGDAAHGVHPIAGQGLNIGLRDVAALTEIIADALRLGRDIGAADVLLPYERWRRFDATMSAFAYNGTNALFSNDNPLLRFMRDAGAGVVDRLPGVKRLLVHEAAGLTGRVPKLLRGELA